MLNDIKAIFCFDITIIMCSEDDYVDRLINLKWLISQTVRLSRMVAQHPLCHKSFARQMVTAHEDFILRHNSVVDDVFRGLDQELYSSCQHEWTHDSIDDQSGGCRQICYCKVCELEKTS